jgi:hypothetical protein
LWWTKHPLAAPDLSSSIIIWGWYNRPVEASVIVDSVSLDPKMKRKGLVQLEGVGKLKKFNDLIGS